MPESSPENLRYDEGDCDDGDAAVHPNAAEGSGWTDLTPDQDCDGWPVNVWMDPEVLWEESWLQ